MNFKNRSEAGKLLAKRLKHYKGKDIIVYALPRGGIAVAAEIAGYLNAPLDIIITRKIGHPYQSEYAIGATAENGHFIGDEQELQVVNKDWLEQEIKKEREEAKRRRERYTSDHEMISCKGKTALLVDDGVATGLTMQVGVMELKHRSPNKIIIAVPIITRQTAAMLQSEVDEVVALDIPDETEFLGAVGAYYKDFPQVSDDQVFKILHTCRKALKPERSVKKL